MKIKTVSLIRIGVGSLLLLLLLSCKSSKVTTVDTQTIMDTVMVTVPMPIDNLGNTVEVTIPIPIERQLNVTTSQNKRSGDVKIVDRSRTRVVMRNNDIGAIISASDSATVTAPITKATISQPPKSRRGLSSIFEGILNNLFIAIFILLLLWLLIHKFLRGK